MKPPLFPFPPTVLLLGWLLAAFGESIAPAHGDVHGQILDLTTQIEKDPKNAELYLKRADLYRIHQLWDQAHADFDRARELDPKLDIVDYTRGRLFLEADWPLSAKANLDRYLARHTNHVDALITRARVHHKLQQRLAAAADYTRAIAASPEARPELFIERAQVLAAEGGPHLATALRGLDEGIQRLGPLVTLQLQAIDLEVRLQRPDAAVARIDRVASQSPRKETWLARRGDVLRQAGRESEAREAYASALQALDTLPLVRRNVPAMAELERRLRAGLASRIAPPVMAPLNPAPVAQTNPAPSGVIAPTNATAPGATAPVAPRDGRDRTPGPAR